MLRLYNDVAAFLAALRCPQANAEVEQQVKDIMADVRREGDVALARYTARFDGVELAPGDLAVSAGDLAAAYSRVDEAFVAALREARRRISNYHQRQVRQDTLYPDEEGNLLGYVVRPLERVGVYVPGGTAAYPSSVLMNVIPALVAGVPQVVLVSPPRPDGSLAPQVLVAAAELGLKEVYRVGGAHAVAALAYGTESLAPVDKVVGPGNIYVATAKRLVYGQVAVDMVAGPSEVLVVADATARPQLVAADLLAQAEHDPLSVAALVTTDSRLPERVAVELERRLAALPRAQTARRALEGQGAALVVPSLERAVEVANLVAPEHLELMVAEPLPLLALVRNAGAVFLGAFSPEPVGDYLAGPNHVLPTSGTARFFSPLGVADFVKRTNVIGFSEGSLRRAAPHLKRLAEVEGLAAHAAAVAARFDLGSD